MRPQISRKAATVYDYERSEEEGNYFTLRPLVWWYVQYFGELDRKAAALYKSFRKLNKVPMEAHSIY